MMSIQNSSRHTCHHCEMEVIRMEDSEPTGHDRLHWNHFDTRRLYPTFLLPLNHSPRDVRAAADTGCPFFIMLWENLRRRCKTHSLDRWVEGLAAEELCFEFQADVLWQKSVSDSNPIDGTPLLPVRDSTSQELYDIVACSVITQPSDEERWNHDFVAVSDWDDPSAGHALARLIDGHTSSSQAIGQIRRRLQYCLDYHDSCKAAFSSIRPRRFISVPDSNDDKARIVQAQNLDRSGDAKPYAALSYCWGHDQVLKLTSANEADMEDGVMLSLLPKTITDAIRVTRELGIKLLWVDSLCLVQDKEDELVEEVAKMHHYYGNAHITISAATAASCSEGFLQDKPLPRENGTRPIDGPFYLPVDLDFQEEPSHLKFVTEEYLYEPQVIDSRAWTLQEGLLSQRLVSFGSRIVGWFCRSNAFGIERGTKNLQPTLAEVCNRLGHLPDRHAAVRKLLVWWEIVEDYTQRYLTDNRDKLPAISGIASVLSDPSTDAPEREHQLGFMAGLLVQYSIAHPPSLEDRSEAVIRYRPQNHFESWLVVVQMLWRPNEWQKHEIMGSAGQTQSSSYIAPSWSWAGHVGKIEAIADMSLRKHVVAIINGEFGDNFDLLSVPAWEQGLRVHEVCVAPISSEAPLGALAGGSLIMEGHIFRPDEEQDRIDEIFFDDGRRNLAPGGCRGLYCLRLVPVYEVELAKYPLDEGMHGIVLEPVDLGGESRTDERVYRRVGLYKVKKPVQYDTKGFSGMIEKFQII